MRIWQDDREPSYECKLEVECLRGQILISFIAGTLVWLSLLGIGVEYAAALGLIAGLFEVVPYLGPILAAIPTIAIALIDSVTKGLLTAGVFLGIQLIENNLIVPMVMKRSVKLNPIIVVVAIIMGGELLGIVGAILAVSFAAAVLIGGQHIINHREQK